MSEQTEKDCGPTDAEKRRCEICSTPTDLTFHHESGGLCGHCLAECGFMATTSSPENVEEPT